MSWSNVSGGEQVVSDLCALVAKYTAGFKIIIEPCDERLPNVPVTSTLNLNPKP